jgi:hypothetical protein
MRKPIKFAIRSKITNSRKPYFDSMSISKNINSLITTMYKETVNPEIIFHVSIKPITNRIGDCRAT